MHRDSQHPTVIRWCHWANVPLLLFMIWSGIVIYWANDVYSISIGNKVVIPLFPEWIYSLLNAEARLADGIAMHLFVMWLFAINGVVYIIGFCLTGEWRNVLPRKRSFRDALHVIAHDLHLTKKPLPDDKFNGAQRFAYTGVIGLGFASVLSGLAIYKPFQGSLLTKSLGGYEVARGIHFAAMLAFCAFIAIHLAQVAKAGWRNFRPMLAGSSLRKGLLLGFPVFAAFIAAQIFVFKAEPEDETSWVIRRFLLLNEKVAGLFYDKDKELQPTRSLGKIRENGDIGLEENIDVKDWRLEVSSGVQHFFLKMDELRTLPYVNTKTDFYCIEGWSAKVAWGGIRFSDFLLKYELIPRDALQNPKKYQNMYVGLETPDKEYYVSIDLPSALLPQTLLAYEMDDAPLSLEHGAPLRLAIPSKYGIKNIKRIGNIFVSNTRPRDYWAMQGYDWFAGL